MNDKPSDRSIGEIHSDRAEQILDFWFQELTPKQWFMGGKAVDDMIAERFGDLLEPALRGELWGWRDTAQGRLAEILVLDQFTRNSFRGTAKAFAGDSAALALAQEVIYQGLDQDLSAMQRAFVYMPLMHAESSVVHAHARDLFSQPGMEKNLESLEDHAAVVAKFGRYPSRNKALGRTSTPAELEYLKDGSGWGQ